MRFKRSPRLARRPLSRLWGYVIAVAMMWTLLVAISLTSSLRQQRQETLEVAREAARTAYEKDVTYRRWNAQHGGVYVPITEETQPNPYLRDVTDRPIEVRGVTSGGPAGEEPLALTLVNPAYMTRQVHELSEAVHGMRGHITSLDPIRPANAPDPWERQALQAFEEGVTEVSSVQELDGVPVMRLMRPLVTEEGCLACHAEQGYEIGDVRGGISVSVPMVTLQAPAQKHVRVSWFGHGALWLVGLAIIGGGGAVIQGNVRTLQESETRYRSLIRAVQAAIIVHDAEGRIVTSNPAAQRIVGLAETQLAGKSLRDGAWTFLDEDGEPMAPEAYPVSRVFATGHAVRDLVVGIPKRGGHGVVWALVDANPIFGESGEIAQVIVTFMDITARKRTERVTEARLRIAAASASKPSEALMQLALDEIEALTGSEIGFYHTLLDDQETLVLQTWSTHTLRHMCEAEGRGSHYPISEAGVWVDCVRERRPVIHNDYASLPHRKGMPPGHAPVIRELVFPIMRQTDGSRGDAGSCVTHEDQVVAIIGVGNKPTDYVPADVETISQLGDFSWEIIERKRAEQEVVRQRDMLENTLESLTYPFFVINADDYTIEMANSASIPDGDFPRGLTCYAVTHKTDKPCTGGEHPCPLEHVMASQAPAKVEHVHYTADGERRYVEVYGYPIFDDEGRVVRMIEYTLDVTDRRRAERNLAEKTAALARSNAELEEFAYIASHDLQEPLRKVLAFGDRLQSRYGDQLDGRGLDYLGRMQNAASRMRQLIDDLLTYSRVTTKAKPLEPVDLNAVVDEVVADLVVRIEETGGRVEVVSLPTVVADRVQMRRVFQNLIGNALKFHRDDEAPVVKIYAEILGDERDPVLEDGASHDGCRIFVEDNGIGFDMAYVKQIFAPFQRLHGRVEYEGTGMGLAICRKIMNRHNGEITVDSEPGRGATFVLTLPVTGPEHKS